MPVTFDNLEIGKEYDRPFLSQLWGYHGYQAISKGVVTPSGANFIILFVTKEKQEALTQYNDYIDGDLLFWEGEERHRTDQRIVNTKKNGEQIYLFYRDIHHTPFTYYGQINLTDYQLNTNRPSEFIFHIGAIKHIPDALEDIEEHQVEFKSLDKTEQDSIVKSRIGHGAFRENLIRLWGGCSVTGVKNLTVLKASHAKPWRECSNKERLDPYNGLLLVPNLDALFDAGLITFESGGAIRVSSKLSGEDQNLLNIDPGLRLRTVFPRNEKYLKYHREAVFKA